MIIPRIHLPLIASTLAILFSCSGKQHTQELLDRAEVQTGLLLDDAYRADAIPRTVEPDGQTQWLTGKTFDWTEGFFPGTCWQFYALTGEESWREGAEALQAKFRNHTSASNHDLGFVFHCSYGAGFKLTGDPMFLEVLVEAGNTLIGRFNPTVGAIKSWDENNGWQASRGWTYPVIIDNMMNLEMLFELTDWTGDQRYREVAIAHANTTMKHHFREDYSSYHVIDYDTITGQPLNKHTAQGYAHESAWARGQAWALYGYTLCYRYTFDPVYLGMACRIADYIIQSPLIPEDKIPYWDYNAPGVPDQPRDASAAAVTASALIELDRYAEKDYYTYASEVLKVLSSDEYLAKPGTNNHFLLMHSVGSIPHGAEIDVPLNYADYYYVEALIRTLERENSKTSK